LRWYRLVFLCRYANQDVYRLLGRDPMTHPLSEFELALFEGALVDTLDREFAKPTETTHADDD